MLDKFDDFEVLDDVDDVDVGEDSDCHFVADGDLCTFDRDEREDVDVPDDFQYDGVDIVGLDEVEDSVDVLEVFE